jgi:hypothetical protein
MTMFDLSVMAAAWKKAIIYQGPSASEEIFKAKLSRLGVKAPFGTPAAKTQLAHALAKSQIVNGGSGNFMGTPLTPDGVNENSLKAELVVGTNMVHSKAAYIASHASSPEVNL